MFYVSEFPGKREALLCIKYYKKVKSESESHSVVSDSLQPHGLYRNSPYSGVGRFSFLQGIFPTQGLKPGLSHCKWMLYQLSHKGHGFRPKFISLSCTNIKGDIPCLFLKKKKIIEVYLMCNVSFKCIT